MTGRRAATKPGTAPGRRIWTGNVERLRTAFSSSEPRPLGWEATRSQRARSATVCLDEVVGVAKHRSQRRAGDWQHARPAAGLGDRVDVGGGIAEGQPSLTKLASLACSTSGDPATAGSANQRQRPTATAASHASAGIAQMKNLGYVSRGLHHEPQQQEGGGDGGRGGEDVPTAAHDQAPANRTAARRAGPGLDTVGYPQQRRSDVDRQVGQEARPRPGWPASAGDAGPWSTPSAGRRPAPHPAPAEAPPRDHDGGVREQHEHHVDVHSEPERDREAVADGMPGRA